jgi:hypothetical protein
MAHVCEEPTCKLTEQRHVSPLHFTLYTVDDDPTPISLMISYSDRLVCDVARRRKMEAREMRLVGAAGSVRVRTAHWPLGTLGSLGQVCSQSVASAYSLMSTSANDTCQACASVTMCGSNSQDARMAHHGDHTHRKLLIEEVVEHVLSVCLGVTVRCSRHVVERRFHDSIDRAAASDTRLVSKMPSHSTHALPAPSNVECSIPRLMSWDHAPVSHAQSLLCRKRACTLSRMQSSHANSQFIK